MDQPKPNRNLSDISHLFLSSIRQRQTNGTARPQRRPPQPPAPPEEMSIDMTPEEFARTYGGETGSESLDAQAPVSAPLGEPQLPQFQSAGAADADRVPPVTAIIGSHLNGQQMDRVRQYARHLAADGQRIGLIEVDARELVVMCFDRRDGGMPSGAEADDATQPAQVMDARQVREAIEELNCDLDRWLLVVPNPRTPQAMELLQRSGQWAVLCTADRDGVVACYRTIKGFAEQQYPRLSLAIIDAQSQAEAWRIGSKLSSVCREFLSCSLAVEPPVAKDNAADAAVAEHMVVCCDGSADSLGWAAGEQWELVSRLLARARTAQPVETGSMDLEAVAQTEAPTQPAPQAMKLAEPAGESMDAVEAVESVAKLTRQLVEDVVMPPMGKAQPGEEKRVDPSSSTGTATVASAAPVMAGAGSASDSMAEVIDLPELGAGGDAILSAVLHRGNGELAECPLRPPMCSEARIAVSRERRLVLLGVTRQGLGDLRAIGQAYRWISENRALIAMALPQFAVDAHQMPQLRLLVDQADLSAQVLQPMLESSNVRVQTYRKLRWGPKTGLLLEAA
jgi:hypothetical protein